MTAEASDLEDPGMGGAVDEKSIGGVKGKDGDGTSERWPL
jgi:hypothetical protein